MMSHIKSFNDVTFIWAVVGVVVALLIGLVIWQHFFPPAGFRISNKVILNNESLAMSTKIMQHPGLPIKVAPKRIIQGLTNTSEVV
jgi:hypothetical protein